MRHSMSWTAWVFAALGASGCGDEATVTVARPAPSASPPPAVVTGVQVGWISREPSLPPPARLDAAQQEGWPEPGQTVHWVAHVLNRGRTVLAGVPYTWRVDDGTSAGGTVDLPPGETVVRLPWRWTFHRHLVSFGVQPPAAAADSDATDDSLGVASDALGVGFWIERSIYDWLLEGGRSGFERLMQGELEHWNAILARAVHATTPLGALDRVRVDRVVVVPDGDLPRNDDLDTDLHWVFSSRVDDRRFLHENSRPDVLADQTIVFHELLHQRGLTDLYSYDVVHGGRDQVLITENGRLVAGSFLMPPVFTSPSGAVTVYRSSLDGLMGTDYRHGARLTEHCANGLNLYAGRRTPRWLDQWGNLIVGFANVVNPTSYVWLLPRRTELALVDQAGAPVADATVSVYVDHDQDAYHKLYVDAPDRTLRSDGRGVAVLSGDLFARSPLANALPKSHVVIVAVKADRGRGFAFIPAYDLNLLYFRSGPEQGTMPLRVTLHPS